MVEINVVVLRKGHSRCDPKAAAVVARVILGIRKIGIPRPRHFGIYYELHDAHFKPMSGTGDW